ncbi:unnamed protein product [Rotaria sp. Silwood2]|nr:unnamed protein product [Rotaria sp. Silwood2]
MEGIIQLFQEFADNMSLETSGRTTESDEVFQPLLIKFQQARENDDNHQDLIRQTIPLCNEFIDTVEKVTFTHMNDFQNCLELLRHIESIFQIMLFIEDEKLLTREILFASLDLLSKPQIHSYLNNDKHTKLPHKEVYKCINNLLLSLVHDKITLAPFVNTDSTTRKYTDIFSAMYKRVKRDLQFSIDIEQLTVPDNQTTCFILSFFWNLSDRTVIVPWLLGIGLVESMLECLKIIEIPSETAQQIISIIHNISRHDEGADEINKFDGLLILKNIQSNSSEALDDLNNLLISMAIALLSTSKQIRSDNKRMNKILNQLLQITIQAAETEDHRGEYRFHVSEPLTVFSKLFVDDHSLEYVLSHAETDPQLDITSTINLFINLFMKFRNAFTEKNQLEQFTCTALLNILWSISFQDRYKTKLQQNKDFLNAINSLAIDNGEKIVDEYVSRSMESMTKAANGILYNLNEISDGRKTDIVDCHLVPNSGGEKPMIMISYAHGNNPFCDKLLVELGKKGNLFGIWIDRNYCSSNEDLWEKIALGIKQSNLILCLLSQDYYNSKSCRKEAIFAIKRKKSIIPSYIGEPGDCDWLGMPFFYLFSYSQYTTKV